MKVTVAIPTYNSTAYIRATLDAVLAQTHRPHEILVFDDGSTDDTVALLQGYGSAIRLVPGRRGGVAHARNMLARAAQGDLVAFLDHDDIWHPRYLETQVRSARQYPDAVAFFTRHFTFTSASDIGDWQTAAGPADQAESIAPADFIVRYNRSTGTFYSMSFCVVRRSLLQRLERDPFPIPTAGVDDFFFCNRLPLFGPVVLNHGELVAYRVTPSSQSVDRLKSFKRILDHHYLLESEYRRHRRQDLLKLLDCEYASKQRFYGRILFGMSQKAEARHHFRMALVRSTAPASMAKSLALLLMSFMPPPFRLQANARYRQQAQ